MAKLHYLYLTKKRGYRIDEHYLIIKGFLIKMFQQATRLSLLAGYYSADEDFYEM